MGVLSRGDVLRGVAARAPGRECLASGTLGGLGTNWRGNGSHWRARNSGCWCGWCRLGWVDVALMHAFLPWVFSYHFFVRSCQHLGTSLTALSIVNMRTLLPSCVCLCWNFWRVELMGWSGPRCPPIGAVWVPWNQSGVLFSWMFFAFCWASETMSLCCQEQCWRTFLLLLTFQIKASLIRI